MASFKRSTKRNMKKVVSTVLISAMCLSGGAAAFADNVESTESTMNNTVASTVSIFSDVKSGFWAEKHIYKLASQGIILGNNGKFRPSDNVTNQEAITMAIRFMNLEKSLSSGETVPTDLKVDNYFKPYLELALKQNLINKDEELKLTGDKETWGQKKASREWVAKILIRAIGQESQAKLATNMSSDFVDEKDISSENKGYVNVAVGLEIANGVAGNKFDPKGNVTRAQMATFLSRGGEHFDPDYSTTYEGVVTELSDTGITLLVDNNLRSFKLDNRSVYFSKDSETKIAQSDLKLFTKVMVIDKVGSAAYVEIRDAKQQLESTEGTLLSTLSNNRLLLLVDNDSVTYTYDNSTVFYDQNGEKIKPTDLVRDSTLVVQRETYSEAKKPVVVSVKSAVINANDTGVIDGIDTANNTIAIKNSNGKVDTFKLDNNSLVHYQTQILTVADLKAGMSIKYSVKNSVVDSIAIDKGIERTVTGTLLSVDGTAFITYSNSAGTPEVKKLADKPVVEIKGINDAKLTDLIADVNGGDKVELTINADEQISRITVLGRQSEQLAEATVVKYDSKLKALMIIDSSKKVHAYTLDEKTKVEYNSTSPTLAGAEALLTEGRKINLTHIGDRVLSLGVVYKYDGTFVTANQTAKTVTIQLADGNTVTVPYQGTQPNIQLYGKASATIADIKLGDSVTMILSANQDTLQSLAVKSATQFEIVSVNTSTSRIRVVANSVADEIYVDGATLTDANGAAIRVADLTAGQTVNIFFNGRTASSVQVVKLTLGKILSVDGNTLQVKSFAGGTDSFAMSSNVKVIKNNVVTTGISALTTSDHVEVRKSPEGQVVVKVLTALEKKVARYDSINKEILVIRASLSDNNYRFAVSADTYVHQGDTTISVQSLKENDKIVLYFNGDKLVEVEKQ